MERAPLLLLGAVPSVYAYAERSLPVASEELELLSMVSALEAQRRCRRVALHRSSAVARRPAREQVLRQLRRRWSSAWPAASMGEELRAAVVLGHSDHTRGQPELVVRRESHEILLLPLKPARALGDMPRVDAAKELRVDFAW